MVRNLRGDQIARMEARHQISEAQFAAGRQQDAIRRLRVIDGTLAVRLGVDVLVPVHAVLLSARSVVDASRGLPKAKPNYWRTAFRLALDEIAALVGLATNMPKRPPVPERYALQAAVMVATVRKSAP